MPLLRHRHSNVLWRSSTAPLSRYLYGGEKAVIDIESLAFIGGKLPPRARGLVIEWATLHQDELRAAFHKAQALEAPEKIAPLN